MGGEEAEVKGYNRLVVPGRFQPPHFGHLYTIKYALSLAREVIVVIGSAQESFTIRNPLTAGERFELLRIMLREELSPSDVMRVLLVPVQDINMNKVWVQYLRMLLPRFEGVVSGNPLVLELFRDMGLAAIKPPMYKPDVCKGSRIRSNAIKGLEWRECIPKSILGELEKLDFEGRLRRLSEGG